MALNHKTKNPYNNGFGFLLAKEKILQCDNSRCRRRHFLMTSLSKYEIDGPSPRAVDMGSVRQQR